MCRNIKLLFHFAPPATEDEMRASSLQYVRKVSGITKPTEANRAAFDRAVDQVTEITRRLLLEELEAPRSAPRNREVEKERAKKRGMDREIRIRTKIMGQS